MTSNFKQLIVLLFCSFFFSITCQAQFKGIFNKVKEKVIETKNKMVHAIDSTITTEVQTSISQSMNSILGSDVASSGQETEATKPTAVATQEIAALPKGKNTTNTTVKPVNSEINEGAIHQFKARPLKNGYTRLRIAGNLALDVKGKYPIGYQPKWRFISYNSSLKLKVENWVTPNSNVNYGDRKISIGDYKGKAMLRYGAFIGCDCFADIVIDDTLAVVTETPQTFRVTNFQKILNERATGEPCVGMDAVHFGGGHQGTITLAANEAGDITMSMMLEAYTAEKKAQKRYDPAVKSYVVKDIPSKVSYRYIADNIAIDNEMSPDQANAIIKAEEEAKQKLKDYMAKSKKQVDSLMKVISVKYAGTECRSCFSNARDYTINPETHEYVYIESGRHARTETDYNLSTSLVIKNKCNYPIMFVGIQQLYNEQRGYYYVDVTSTMEANYEYQSQQSALGYLITTLAGASQDIYLQKEYSIGGASKNSIQWLKVVKAKN